MNVRFFFQNLGFDFIINLLQPDPEKQYGALYFMIEKMGKIMCIDLSDRSMT